MDEIDRKLIEEETETNPCGCGKEGCRTCQLWNLVQKLVREAEEQAGN